MARVPFRNENNMYLINCICRTCQTSPACAESEEHEISPTSPPSSQRPPPSNQRPLPSNQGPRPNGRPPRPPPQQGRPRPQSPPNQRPRPPQQNRPRPRPGQGRRPWQRESGFGLEQSQYNVEEIWNALGELVMNNEGNWDPWQQQNNNEENWDPWQQQNSNNEENLPVWWREEENWDPLGGSLLE